MSQEQLQMTHQPKMGKDSPDHSHAPMKSRSKSPADQLHWGIFMGERLKYFLLLQNASFSKALSCPLLIVFLSLFNEQGSPNLCPEGEQTNLRRSKFQDFSKHQLTPEKFLQAPAHTSTHSNGLPFLYPTILKSTGANISEPEPGACSEGWEGLPNPWKAF